MCGILCEISYSCSTCLGADIIQRIKNRGPDSFRYLKLNVGNIVLHLYSSVLWMQGKEITSQPAVGQNGTLLYNGDIYDSTWHDENSDTKNLINKLNNVVNESNKHIIQVIQKLQGPICIVYFNKLNNKLYFCRDRLGRNSLLFHGNQDSFVISSVLGTKYKCVDIPATYIYELDISTKRICLYNWTNHSAVDEYEVDKWLKIIENQQMVPDDDYQFNFNLNMNLNDEDNILNDLFDIGSESISSTSKLQKILDLKPFADVLDKVLCLLDKSVALRLKKQPMKCKKCLIEKILCSHSSVGILFSGGLDCTILALLSDKYIPIDQSIDLINVAFDKTGCSSYDVPDRLTGLKSLEEIKVLCPLRKWIFKEVNVPKEKLLLLQNDIIADLIYPRITILDESLGTALWFAANGYDDKSISECRVLLLGSGADELFGGYMRHRKAFKSNNWLNLSKELQLDWERISFRNLARDNRVICDNGRQPRMPYLDENFAHYVLNLKPWFKCFPSDSLGLGVGDKLMLRLIAFKLGLTNVAILPKRALQFGSRIANKKEKGSDISKVIKKLIND